MQSDASGARMEEPMRGHPERVSDDEQGRGTRREPLISCITIFLNGEAFIGEAIESVLAQSYSNWELILVDDGPVDGATEIARRYAAAHPGRITCIEHPNHENRGMSASRNAGVRIARGEYIAFLDADDVWLPDRLVRHLEVLDPLPDIAMSMSPTLTWCSWNRGNLPRSRPWLAADMTAALAVPAGIAISPPDMAISCLEGHGAGLPGICSPLIRRDPLIQVGGFEEQFRTLFEDQAFLFKIFLNYKVIALDVVLDYYRQHDASACRTEGSAGEMEKRGCFCSGCRATSSTERTRTHGSGAR
ncbi:MAG: glycosyltransferase family 2 protein [Alphaproteobacteria bacterium]